MNMWLYAGSLEGNAYSHLSRLFCDETQWLYNRSWKYGGESEWRHLCLLRWSLDCW